MEDRIFQRDVVFNLGYTHGIDRAFFNVTHAKWKESPVYRAVVVQIGGHLIIAGIRMDRIIDADNKTTVCIEIEFRDGIFFRGKFNDVCVVNADFFCTDQVAGYSE